MRCLMIKRFVPEYYFPTFNVANADFLLSIGVKCVILDVDNTLEPYENPLPGDNVKAWIKSLNDVGIVAAIVSNNNRERIDLFNSELGLLAYTKAKKPLKKYLCLAMSALGVKPEETIFIGDQVFTDVWAAHNAGVRAILVPPIRDKRDILTRFKRWLEKPVLKYYRKHIQKGDNK